MIKVAYLGKDNPANPYSWSGTNHFMFRSLPGSQFAVTHVGRSLASLGSRLPHGVGRMLNALSPEGLRSPVPTREEARAAARLIEKELRKDHYHLIFAPVSAREIAYLETDLPVVYLSDSTIRLITSYYPAWAQKSPDEIAMLEEFEARAIERADLVIYPSYWAFRSAIEHYGASLHKLRVIPFGANLSTVPQLETILDERRDRSVCRLLFLGREWDRKGGQVAFDAMAELNRRGIRSELHVCGTKPPATVDHPGLRVEGLLAKDRPADLKRLQQLLCQSHFLILPTRAEAYGIVFCEASGYGLPSLAPRTGGIPSIITPGVNGYLFPTASTGVDYAEMIARTFQDSDGYDTLCRSARRRYDQVLNWESWAASVQREIRSLLFSPSMGSSPKSHAAGSGR